MKKSTQEIEDQIDLASDQISVGASRWSGMTYEEGVRAALEWVLGNYDEAPMED